LTIARKAGSKNAEKWFNASIAQGRTLFQSAREADADDIIINVNYAFSLLALENEDWKEMAYVEQILHDVLSEEPSDYLSRILQSYARKALTQIENRDAVRDYAGMFLDGEVPEFK